ncbi:MAG: hypothetical protein AB1805_04795 [Nitrospirota bacterium]
MNGAERAFGICLLLLFLLSPAAAPECRALVITPAADAVSLAASLLSYASDTASPVDAPGHAAYSYREAQEGGGALPAIADARSDDLLDSAIHATSLSGLRVIVQDHGS